MARQTQQVQTPWGDRGQAVNGKGKRVYDVMREHGLDWTVNLEPTFLEDGTMIPDSFVTRRDTDGAILGVVGKRYKPLQNVDAFGFFDSFVESKQAEIVVVGSFKGGRTVFIQAEVKVDPIEIVKDDIIKSYITIGHAHDGTAKISAGFTPVRMFCINQLPMLKKSSSSKLLSMKHTKNASITLEAIKGIMNVHRQEFLATAEQFKYLARKGVTKKTLEKYVTLVFQKSDEDESDKQQVIDKITYNFEHGRGLGGKNMKNCYGMFNAVTEYLTWEAGRTVDNRLASLWFGENQRRAQKALDVAIQLAR